MSQRESQGKSLSKRDVVVEGRNVGDRVIAILQPVKGNTTKHRSSDETLFSKD
jgi:hypothetical protein